MTTCVQRCPRSSSNLQLTTPGNEDIKTTMTTTAATAECTKCCGSTTTTYHGRSLNGEGGGIADYYHVGDDWEWMGLGGKTTRTPSVVDRSTSKRALGRAMRWTRPACTAQHSCV